MRWFAFLVPLLAVMALIANEDRKEKGGGDSSPREKEEARPAGKARPLFDADEFIKEYDQNKDGSLAKDELPRRFRHQFDKIDTNKDGKLNKEELEKGVASLQPGRKPSDFVFVLVEMSDCDECCAEELQVVYDFLRKIDRNKDGKVEADELKGAREELVEKRISAIFEELDANKDKKISQDEARGMVKRHFDELDTDKDGFISRDELMKAAVEKPGSLKKDRPGKEPAKSPPEK
jgi:Ca2+-binding EF-hand superfamily protein